MDTNFLRTKYNYSSKYLVHLYCKLFLRQLQNIANIFELIVCLEGRVRLLLGGLKDFLSSRALCYKKPRKFKTGFIPLNHDKPTEYRGKSMK